MRRLRWPSTFLSVLIASTLISPLPVQAQDSDPSVAAGVDPANEPYAKPAPPDPPTLEERLPVVDLSELPGLWPEDIVEVFPGKADPISPSDAIEGATPLPAKGDATTDVFGVGDGATEHLALVGAEPKNERDSEGNWSERELTLDPVAGGWSWTDLAGVRFTFPLILAEASPLLVETADGSLSLVPTPALPGGVSSVGIVDGASVTYPDAVAGNDLVYTLTPLGLQEEIILEKAPDTATVTFTVTMKGLSLAPNAYGGVDVTGADSKSVARSPPPLPTTLRKRSLRPRPLTS
jgi:hypothetical protein